MVQDLILQAGGVMGFTYYIIELVKPLIPDNAKKYIPFISAILAWLLNFAMLQNDFTSDFLSGLLMWFTASKWHDIKKTLSGQDLAPYTKDDEIDYDLPNG